MNPPQQRTRPGVRINKRPVPVAKPAPAPVAKPAPAPVAKPAPAPVAKPAPAPVAKPAPAPVAKPAPAPVAKPTPVPVAKPTPVPVAKPAPAPVAKPAPAPVAKPAPAPVAKPAPVPVAKPAPVPAAKPAPVPVAKPAPVPVAKPAPVPARSAARGIVNLGNTCYINACLQMYVAIAPTILSLLNLAAVHISAEKETSEPQKICKAFIHEWRAFMEDATVAESTSNSLRPAALIAELHKFIQSKKYSSVPSRIGATGDAVETFMLMLDCLHDVIKRPLNPSYLMPPASAGPVATACFEASKTFYAHEYSPAIPMFYGMQWVITTPQISLPDSVKWVEGRADPFSTLDMQLPLRASVAGTVAAPIPFCECIQSYLAPEIIEEVRFSEEKEAETGEYKFCGRAKRQIYFWCFPEFLIVHLKRLTARGTKDPRIIDFPLDGLDLSPWAYREQGKLFTESDCHQSGVYDARAVCWHTGGHYLTYSRGAESAPNKWVCYNDSGVHAVSNVKQMIHSPHVSCIIYQRR